MLNAAIRGLLSRAQEHALEYMDGIAERPVFPDADALAGLSAFDEALPAQGRDALATLELLHRQGSPATTAQTGPRYFGFVNGGLDPTALAARWLADAWDQNSALWMMSPTAAKLEAVTERWLVELLGLPRETVAGFVSGTAVSLVCGIAAARNALLSRAGWDVARQGLFEAPPLRVVTGAQAHATVARALSLLGLGSDRIERVPCDAQGRLRLDALPELDAHTLVLAAAGNVNSGAFDPLRGLCERAHAAGAWVHVDGAFGLWAAAAPARAHLCDGIELADSWSGDAHKTLNAPYDGGLILCRDGAALEAALHMDGAYIAWSEEGARDGMRYTPEMSRRARAVEIWALLRSRGSEGVAALIEGMCQHAAQFAGELEAAGFSLCNEVVFNQVLVACADDALTEATLAGVQASGECWCGASSWHGRRVIRISVCSGATTAADVSRSVAAFVRARDAACAAAPPPR